MSGESLAIVALSAELTRLRAALAEIAALQTEEPDGYGNDDAFAEGRATGQRDAACLAKTALVKS